MRDAIIDMIDALAIAAVILVTGIVTLASVSAFGDFGLLLGLLTFVVMGLAVGFWLCLSGIYHNTKLIATTTNKAYKAQQEEQI